VLSTSKYDVCIIGSGVAGAMVAKRLAGTGAKILMLEAGKQFDRSARFEQLRSHEILRTPLWPWVSEDRDGYVDLSAPEIGYTYTLNDSRIKAVGGSTLFWGGLINRFRETDFNSASTYGMGLDWPISYADLERYYCDAEAEVGVAGQQNPGDPPRSRELPMPLWPPKYGEDAWFRVAEKMGFEIGLANHARNSTPYGNRPACAAISVCPVCPIGARYSADYHVDQLVADNLVELAVETVARRLITNDRGHVEMLLATDLDGTDYEIRADNYVIAAQTIETARLLLLSEVGNESDQVGRNLMEHWYTGAGGFIDDKVFPRRIGFETLECNHWYDGPDREVRGAIKLSFIEGRDPLMYRDGLVGTDLAEKNCREFGHWVGVAAEIEHQPNPESRVTLSESQTDQFGDPVPVIKFALSDVDRRTHDTALEVTSMLAEARGCRDVTSIGSYHRAHHHMGTCRMSSDPALGVVDANCKVHSTDNLYVAGASVFPTGGGRQPMLTIAAMALRLGEHLATRR